MAPRPRLNLKRHTVNLDEETDRKAREAFEKLQAEFGGLSWSGFLAGLVRDGLKARAKKAPR